MTLKKSNRHTKRAAHRAALLSVAAFFISNLTSFRLFQI
jgi:hypothetical protein